MFSLTQVTNFLIYFPGTTFILAVTLAILGYRKEPRRLLNAWFLVVGATILLGMPIILLASLSDTHQIGWLILSGLATFALGIGLADWLMLGAWHFNRLHRHFRIVTLISILVGFGLAILPTLRAAIWPINLITPMRYVNTGLILLGSYMVITILDFLVATWTYPRHHELNGEHYLIILGSGLRNGNQLSKLLQARVDKALDVAKASYQKDGSWPVLIMTGGQGVDETVTEASAMAEYAKQSGYLNENIFSFLL